MIVPPGAAPLVLAALLLATGGGGAAAQSTATRDDSAKPAQEARRAFNRLVSAANRLDADGEAELFWRSPDLVSVAQGTPTFGWEERTARARQWYGVLRVQKIRPLEVETRVLGSDAVALVATYEQEIEAKDGRAWEGRGVWTLVFRRVEPEGWRIVWEHYSYEERGRS